MCACMNYNAREAHLLGGLGALQKCKGHFNPHWVTSVASVQSSVHVRVISTLPGYILSVADVSIMAQLANLN